MKAEIYKDEGYQFMAAVFELYNDRGYVVNFGHKGALE